MRLKGLKMMLNCSLKNYKTIKIFLFLLLTVLLTSCQAKSHYPDSVAIGDTIQKIYLLIKNKRGDLLTQNFISKQDGVYVVYRLGVRDMIKHIYRIDLNGTNKSVSYQSLRYPIQKLPHTIKQKKVSYNCLEDRWTENGFFLNAINKNHIFSDKIDVRNLYCFTDTINGIRFYLKKIDHIWYLYIIDEITGNCDA